jgi:hypothetical protein
MAFDDADDLDDVGLDDEVDEGWDDEVDAEPPICPWCGATALPVVPEDGDPGFVCETPGCDAFGLRLA